MIIGEAPRQLSDNYKYDAMHSYAESFVNLAEGILNEDATTITYIDDEKVEQTVTIASLMEKFCSMSIEFGVKVKSEEELDIEDEAEEVDIDELTADE